MSSLQKDILFIIEYISFSQTSLVWKFNLVLIEKFSSEFIYLSTFQYFAYHPVPLHVFL